MKRVSRMGWIVALFAALNVLGWVWMRGAVLAAERGKVRIVDVRPAKADGARQLSFFFDRALARADQLEQPLAEPPLRLEPAVAGHWLWSAPDRLSFVPDEP